MVIREKYLNQIRGFYDSDLIKVITGVRRCGKSYILESIKDEIKLKTSNYIYLNFENLDDFIKANNAEKLIKLIRSIKEEGKCYCFFDEIQEVKDWQYAVRTLRLENCSIFITGSNSKLLSSEFLTLLSGRFVSFRIRPFVYKEIIEYGKITNSTKSIEDYLVWGGFPGRLSFDSVEQTRNYLNEIENTIVINDLIKRYNIRKQLLFKKMVSYILGSNSRIYSIRSIYNYLKIDFEDVSTSTVAKYLDYLKQAYIIDEIPQYSKKKKSELRFYGKIYNCDVGFNSLKIDNNRFDFDHNLENVVYNELLYRGYNLKVFNDGNGEIDFIANNNNKTYYIQVAYSVVDDKAYNREMKPFAKLDNTNEKILITNDIVDYSTSTVRHIKLKDFLLMEDL